MSEQSDLGPKALQGPSGSRRHGASTRQEQLVEHVRLKGFVSIEAMADHFNVSSQTIRRDIDLLCKQNKLARYHGGAGLPPGSESLAYSNRRIRYLAEKKAIAGALAARIPNGASLFIDIGTTMEAVAEALCDHKDLRILTNHVRVVSVLSERTDFEIVLAGGLVRNKDQAITGEATSEFVRTFKVGYGLFGVGAIDASGDIRDYDYRDVQVSTSALAISKYRFAAADHSKFDGDAMVLLCHASTFDAFFTDKPPPTPIMNTLAANDVELVLPDSVSQTAKEH